MTRTIVVKKKKKKKILNVGKLIVIGDKVELNSIFIGSWILLF